MLRTIHFTATTHPDEYELGLAIRRAVFVEEQKVPEALEVDEYELSCVFFLTYQDGTPAATGRLRVKDQWIKFERIATQAQFRGLGLGRSLMKAMMEYASRHYGHLTPYMHSQLDAVPFYEKLGWMADGDVFDEAGIPHRAMKSEH